MEPSSLIALETPGFSAPAAEDGASHSELLGLQRAAGNRAVVGWMKKRSDRGGAEAEPDRRSRIPKALRVALEAGTGFDLSAIRVHRNSSAPAALNAYAHARGGHIFLAPGRADLLPHEAWHVVQQMQGRVTPTAQLDGIPANDDARLEREAREQGARAMKAAFAGRAAPAISSRPTPRTRPAQRWRGGAMPAAPIQRAMKFEIQTANRVWMVTKGGTPYRAPRKYGAGGKSERGEESFLTTGTEGRAHVRKGGFEEAVGVDRTKPSEYIVTFQVLDQDNWHIKRLRTKRRKSKRVNKGTYELRYVDKAGKRMDVHRDPHGRFATGPGPLMRKAQGFEKGSSIKEGSAIELQSENGGFIEFETPKWERKWKKVHKRIQEAVEMTKEMDKAPLVQGATKAAIEPLAKKAPPAGTLHRWPTSFPVDHLPIVKAGGRLVVEIRSPSWNARIQTSEGLELPQYESLLEDHERAKYVGPTKTAVDKMLKAVRPRGAAAGRRWDKQHPNLRGLLLMVSDYVISAGDPKKKKRSPSKFSFRLMSRTSFYSMYHQILNRGERDVFTKLVRDGTILSALNAKADDKVFPVGHGGVGAKSRRNPSVGAWLTSIIRGGGSHPDRPGEPTDLLSKPRGGSDAMGRFDVDKRPGKKHSNLIRIEVRNTKTPKNDIGRDKWVDYAESMFKIAATHRPRPDRPDDPATRENEERKTGLIYP